MLSSPFMDPARKYDEYGYSGPDPELVIPGSARNPARLAMAYFERR
jgi:hypothetical protein